MILRVLAPALLAGVACDPTCTGRLVIGGVGPAPYTKGYGGYALGDSLHLEHDSGFSITTSCREEGWDPDSFLLLRLLGKTLSYSVDLSRVGCACNLALYLIQEPALDTAGEPRELGEDAPEFCNSTPYYCDANRVCGQWCPEMDIMEANNRVFQSTPHSCDGPSSKGHYSNCDRAGCGQSTKDMGKDTYGPGPGFAIDTTRPFDVHTQFHGNSSEAGGRFTGMTTVLRQGTREVILDHSNCGDQYASMAAPMAAGMALRITYWGSDAKTMSWLDKGLCGTQRCSRHSNAGIAAITGLRLTDVAAPITSLPPLAVPRPSNDTGASTSADEPYAEWLSALPWVILLLVSICALCGLGYCACGRPGWPKDTHQPLVAMPSVHSRVHSREHSKGEVYWSHPGNAVQGQDEGDDGCNVLEILSCGGFSCRNLFQRNQPVPGQLNNGYPAQTIHQRAMSTMPIGQGPGRIQGSAYYPGPMHYDKDLS